ncbi:MAG TPA: ACT domain-containing protein, partial [Bryobacteraceae bacterium]|nr:ACT domain-containing protein [Bryobacteraceae bacterium]
MLTLPDARVLLVNVTGSDRPGLTHSLTDVLAHFDARILDVGQAVIHDALTLGILIELTDTMRTSGMFAELLLKAHDLGVQVRFSAITASEYSDWVSSGNKRRFIITLLGPCIDARHLSAVSGILAEATLNIDRIDRLSGRQPLDGSSASRTCIEVSASGSLADEDSVRAKLAQLTDAFDIDIAVQHESIFRRNRRLVAFDMDSTLIQAEVIDELARLAGVGEQVSAITEAAMRGELDFQASFRKRLSLLRGLPESRLNEILDKLPLMDGAERL